MGKLGGGVVLVIIGAILAFAVSDSFSGVDLTTIGYILMAGGGVLAVIGLILSLRGSRVKSSVKSTGPGGDQITTREDKIS